MPKKEIEYNRKKLFVCQDIHLTTVKKIKTILAEKGIIVNESEIIRLAIGSFSKQFLDIFQNSLKYKDEAKGTDFILDEISKMEL